MKKKKAIKVLSASVIAASAFVSVNPTEAATVGEVEKLMSAALDAGTILKWAISIEGTADGTTRPWTAYNNAKTAYDKALQAVNTLPSAQRTRYLAELDEHVKLHITRTMYYIDAITAGEKIRVKQQALASLLNRNLINDDTEKAYHELSKEIRKQAILLDRVYGKTTRDLIRSHYKQAAERVRNSALYAVTVKIELDLAQKAIAVNNYAKAETHLTNARIYIPYVENAVMKRALTDRLNAIEGRFIPTVQKISASEPKRIKVEFNKAMLTGSGTNGAENTSNYSVSGRSIKSVTLTPDRKSAIIELYDPLYTNSFYTVTVKRNIQTTNYESLTKDYVTSFTFKDNIKPSVTSVTANSKGHVEIRFSELIDGNSSISVTIDGKAVNYNSLNSETDIVTIPRSELDRLGLRKGRTYSIVVSGARDLVAYTPNTMNIYRGSFLYNPAADTIAPEVKSIYVKDERTFTIEFSESLASLTAASNLTITKGNSTIRPTSVKDVSNRENMKFDIELPISVYSNNEVSARLNVQVKSYKDLEGNSGRTSDRTITINRDLTPPRFINASYNLNTNEIQLAFDKPLKTVVPDRSKITLTYQGSTFNPSVKTNVDNKLIINASGLKDGTYTISVAAGTVQDRTISENKNHQFTTSVTKKSDSVLPEVTFRETNGNGQFEAIFSEEVDAASATTAGNYLLDGTAISSSSVLSISRDLRFVTITLPEGTIKTTQQYSITARGIKDLSDNMMKTYTAKIWLTDNTQPILQRAEVDKDDYIRLTFSENIFLIGSGTESLNILLNGKSLSPKQFSLSEGRNSRELLIYPEDNLSFNTGSISITTKENQSIQDSDGNTLKAGTTVVLR